MAAIGKSLVGKVAVVTGASSGIGRESARLFAEAGARVVVGYNQGVDRANAVVAGLAGEGHKAMRLPLEDTPQIRRAAQAVREEFGRADILVNSAGFTRMVPHHDLEALDDDLIDQVLTANVRGPFATIRAFVPLLRESGDGVIINISSGAAEHGTGSSIIYGASKAALNTMSMALARVLGPEIRVVVVAPGMVHTGFVPGRTEEMMARAAASTPLKRAIEPEDVALAVISCVTHLTHTTGSVISVDAGRHL
jgi:3-oxoacyl-[acyl-carrier protein] reductase